MFDKKKVMITEPFVSEVEFISNSSQPSASADWKGGIVDGQETQKSREEKISKKKEALTPHA